MKFNSTGMRKAGFNCMIRYIIILLETPVEFPEEFLKKWMQRGGEKEKSAEEVEAEFPTFTNQLKWTLISDKIIQENNMEVTQEELRDICKKEIHAIFRSNENGWRYQLDGKLY